MNFLSSFDRGGYLTLYVLCTAALYVLCTAALYVLCTAALYFSL
jgi:hypothetical protein